MNGFKLTDKAYKELLATRTERAKKSRFVEPRCILGIDPGENTGMAIIKPNQKPQVMTKGFWSCFDYVNESYFSQYTVLVIEQGGLNSPLFSSVAERMAEQYRRQGRTITQKDREAFRRAENKHAMNVGAANEQAELLIEGFTRRGYYVVTFRPVAGKKWKTHEIAKAHTGIVQQTNDHTRVALQLAWDYRSLLTVTSPIYY